MKTSSSSQSSKPALAGTGVLALGALLFAACGLAACGGGGGGSSGLAGQGGFQITKISVENGAVWKINRPISFTFNLPLDFSTVNLLTLNITDASGLPVTGEFTLDAPTVVTFQPTCPKKSDLSDAGFQPGGVSYTIRVLGEDSGASLTVKSSSGSSLVNSQTRSFVTPNSLQPAQIFIDGVIGPPTPIVHTTTSLDSDPGTYLELGGDPDNRIYFEFNALTQSFTTPGNVPLNLYSDSATQVAVFLEINQPVNPAADNISPTRLLLESFDSTTGNWRRVSTVVELLANCTTSGATVRILPLGLLPQSALLRVVISSSFEDIVGERNLLDVNQFGQFTTKIVSFPTLTPSTDLADEVFESFDLGATSPQSLQDASAAFAEPQAKWGNGKLSPAFDFTGNGGTDGAFDLYLSGPNGTLFSFNTGSQSFQGGTFAGSDPELGAFTPGKQQTVIGGILNVRHMRIDSGVTLRILGPNPAVIQATGKVVVEGTIDASGFDSQDVATLNTGNQFEDGAPGTAAGGKGGVGNFLTTTSTPQGGNGQGAYNTPNLGGFGGESGYDTTASTNIDKRRPGGGGGGAFGANEGAASLTSLLTANPGRNGGAAATGAITGLQPPKGGAVGTRPFFDGNSTNDFFGRKFDAVTSTVTLGELTKPWAGHGGGAGGNACAGPTFPTPGWSIASDEKGCGGGGGGASLLIQALDTVKLKGGGRINVDGGDGGAGENTIGLNHVGGGSGGGSGGHLIIQAGKKIDFSTSTINDSLTSKGGKHGAGQTAQADSTDSGGSGGPGVIQLHTLGGAADILLPSGKTLAQMSAPDSLLLVPTFGARSKARSVWIPVGGAGVAIGGGVQPIEFFFEGISTATGLVNKTSGVVDDATSILGPVTLVSGDIQPDGRTVIVDSTSMESTAADIFLRNPELLDEAKLRLQSSVNPNAKKTFDVASASWNPTTHKLSLTVASSGALLTSFNPGGGAQTQLVLQRRFFRVVTSGTQDSLPASANIRVKFEGAQAKVDGTPDETTILVPKTANIANFNLPSTLGKLQFIRFEVEFDIDALGTGLSPLSPRPELEYLRMPFRF
jgi:hypothetical protein